MDGPSVQLAPDATDTESTHVRVPEDGLTLKEAVAHASDRPQRQTTIVLGKGQHSVDGYYLDIPTAMNIIGHPNVPATEVVVVGGVYIKANLPGTVHLQHMTIRESQGAGVSSRSSFTMEDVVVELCAGSGVEASGSAAKGKCTNVEVRQCSESGVVAANGGSIALIGSKTQVHHNCTDEDSDDHGLEVYGSLASTIQLVAPLTKEVVSFDNGGDGARNWGCGFGADVDRIVRVSVAVGETKVQGNSPRGPRRTPPVALKEHDETLDAQVARLPIDSV